MRLTKELREALTNLMREKILLPKHDDAELDAREDLAAALRRGVKKMYPQKDMKLLHKYNYAGTGYTPHRLRLHDGRCVHPFFTFYKKASNNLVYFPDDYDWADGLLMPQNTSSGEWQFDAIDTKVYDNWERVAMTRLKAYEEIHKDYLALIQHSKTMEQVAKVWPAAQALIKKQERLLPVVVLDDVISRIARDQANRAK